MGSEMCIRDRNRNTPVPGCQGTATPGYDYCIRGPVLKTLRGHNPRKAKKGELLECEGDCDKDRDCKGNLVCFQRNRNTPVPGCQGTATPGYDYCIRGPVLKTLRGHNPRKAKKGELLECEGDCDKDRDCKGNLVCFQRNQYEKVPGCQGYGRRGYDYCTRRRN